MKTKIIVTSTTAVAATILAVTLAHAAVNNRGESCAVYGSLKLETLAHLLGDSSNRRVRVRAALSLGRLGDREGSRALLRGLRDPEPVVRTAALAALARAGDPRIL